MDVLCLLFLKDVLRLCDIVCMFKVRIRIIFTTVCPSAASKDMFKKTDFDQTSVKINPQLIWLDRGQVSAVTLSSF